MKNIIYIQGSLTRAMERLPFRKDRGVTRLLGKYGDNIIIPKVLWHTEPGIYDRLCEIIENEDISALVSNSAGGYMGFHLSNKYDIPSLMFNPCIVEGKGYYDNEAPTLQDIPDNVKNLPVNDKMLIFVGKNDKKRTGGVEPRVLMEVLEEKGFFETESKIHLAKNVGHSIPYWLFNRGYDRFYDKFLK